jgi:hypothetical protein
LRLVLQLIRGLLRIPAPLISAEQALSVARAECERRGWKWGQPAVSEGLRHWCIWTDRLKKKVRGIRPIERKVESRQDAEAEAIRGYCAAVRSAPTDDGRPPLEASGLKLRDRPAKVADSLDRVDVKRGSRRN